MHWFDELAKALASRSMSRRTLLLGTGTVAGAVLADRALGASNVAPNPAVRLPSGGSVGVPPSRGVAPRTPARVITPVVQRYGPCTYRSSGPQRDFSFESQGSILGSAAQLSLQQTTQATSATRGAPVSASLSATLYVERAGHLFMRVESSTASVPLSKNSVPHGSISVTYGPEFGDLRSARYTFSGSLVTGTVNDRAILPFQASTGATEASLKFADGKPPPAGLLDQRLIDEVRQFGRKAQAEMRSCGTLPRSASGLDQTQLAWTPAYLSDGGGFQPGAVIASTVRITPQYTFGRSGSCDGCNKGCDTSFGICMLAAGFFCPPCAPACYGEWTGCWAACFIPGVGGCCDKACQPFSCCDNDETCCGGYDGMCCSSNEACSVLPRGAVCCPNDWPVGCGDPYSNASQCCKPGSTCCVAGYAYCCDPGYTCCGTPQGAAPVCCPPEASVCLDPSNGTCCAANRICGKQCCGQGESCYTNSKGEGVCCVQPLCGDQCCVSGELCNHNTGQCGYGKVCGNSFCGFGYDCVNGQCVPSGPSPAVCSPPLVPCPYTSICCDTNNPDPTKKQICCATVCCNALTQDCCSAGHCCPRGSIH